MNRSALRNCLVNFYVTYKLSLSAILRLGLECPRSQSLQPRMQVDIFLLQRGLESRTTCSQTFLENVSVESYNLSAHATSTQQPLKFNELLINSLLTFYITCQVLKSELCRVISRNRPLKGSTTMYCTCRQTFCRKF